MGEAMSATATIEDVLQGRARWCVVGGDNATVLPTMPDKSVAHAITDPPYAPRAMKNAAQKTMTQRRDGVVLDYGYAALTETERSAAAISFARLASRWVLAWCDIESVGAWIAATPPPARYVRTGIWVRGATCPQFSGDRPAQGVEACVISHASGRMRWNGGGSPAVWHHAIVNSNSADRAHTTPKPVPLMLELVSLFTDPDELVLDPFAGSGTTGVACLRLGRRFIGIEKDARYAAIARERLAAEVQGLSLKDARAGQLPMFGEQPKKKPKPENMHGAADGFGGSDYP